MAAVDQTSPSEGTVLRLDQPISRELGGGKSHFYRVSVSRGQYFHAAVAPFGVDVAVSVLSPQGTQVLEFHHPGGALDDEHVAWIAQVDGIFVLQVRSVETSSRPGPYTIILEQLRTATDGDEIRVTARRAFAEAENLVGEGSSDSRHRALAKYQEALSLWQQLKDSREEAACHVGVGRALDALGELRRALDSHERALSLSRVAADRRGEAAAITEIGTVHFHLGESEKAIEDLNQAILLWRATGYRGGEEQVLIDLGAVYVTSGDRQKAIEYYGQGLPLAESIGDRDSQASALSGMGVAYDWLGDPQKALDFCTRSVDLMRAAGYRAQQATALNNLSLVYNELGEHEKALELLAQALLLRRETGDRRGEAYTLTGIGQTYDFLGRREKALDHYTEALALRRAVGDRRGEAITLTYLSLVRASLGQTQEALDGFSQALSLCRAIGDRGLEAETLHHMGFLYASLGENAKALETLTKALGVLRALGNLPGEARALSQIARVAENRGDLSEARSRLEEALTIIESVRTRLGSPELRSSFLATAQEAFGFAVDLWMRSHEKSPGQKFDEVAFAWNERARARSMLDLLAQVNIREGVDPALLEREHALQQRLSFRVEKRMRLLSGSYSVEQADVANREIEALKSELGQVNAQIRRTGPRYAALTQPQPLKLSEIQRELDPDTLLLEYALGKKRSFLWVVTPASVAAYELPASAEIEAAARLLYGHLTERNRRQMSETLAQRLARTRRADEEYRKAARGLSEALLGPARSWLANKRLAIVADGALQYLPFGALPDPTKESAFGDERPLIVSHEIVNLPSASVLVALRREIAGRGPRPKTLAVLADPVFDKQDERVGGVARLGTKRPAAASSPKTQVEGQDELFRSAVDSGVSGEGSLSIPRLRFTRSEAKAILSLVPTLTSRREALDFEASRTTALDPNLSDYRFVHFATHGLLDSRHPELSGLVLSLVDRKGNSQAGFLTPGDVFNLSLPADLVVLSGCQTALGKEIRGEGLVGLTRAFFYAGTARVTASLWRVDDMATAELMTLFYRGMLGSKKLSPAAALRSAQLELLSRKRWSAPYYWSGFVLQGEWK